MMIQAHIFYSGRVQGVGFRFTVVRYAADLDLRGWVKNLPDGRVEILAEGDREKIEQFCQRIEKHFQGYIKDENIDFVPAQENYADFDIAF
ncbi:MAG: acylphosphatase [Candidatus Omnitrophica bacterium]|nr:acylphosphatase [Candidatus Omnitrophota bacterium]